MKVGDLVAFDQGQKHGIIIERLLDRPAPPRYVGRARKWFRFLVEDGSTGIACEIHLEVINENR